MIELENVLSDYLETKAVHARVPGQNITASLRSIRQDIPRVLREFVASAGYNPDEFHIHGSAGEPNRSFPKVPWVAIFKKSVTRSAQKGYYIVLLFSEDMSSVALSLNQGYTAFEKRYVYPKLAYEKLRDCARAASRELSVTTNGFVSGSIDLHTTGQLAKGYEAGAILSKSYPVGGTPAREDLEQDVHSLLHAYLELTRKYPDSLIDLDVDVPAADFSEAVENIVGDSPETPSTTGPQPPPAKGFSNGKPKYVRSPEVASRALAMAKAVCALTTEAAPHISFVSAKSKRNYVEAHHIVPFSQQQAFSVSLDVEENIAALCPTCHRMLHYGIGAEKTKHLKTLHVNRSSALQARGIDVTFEQLKQMYRALSEDD